MKKLAKKINLFLIALFTFMSLVAIPAANNVKAYSNANAINDFQGVANYIHKYGKLPSNYITKAQASKLGWKPGQDLWKYAKGKSIGGDVFTNSEKCLPDARGRVWHECDINYNGGHRGADRILYSNDGLIYGTSDHYQTFTCYYGAKSK